MRDLLLSIPLFFCSLNLFSQDGKYYDNSINSIHKGYSHSTDMFGENSLGIYPEVQFIRSPVIAVNASFARISEAFWGELNSGVNLGFEFDPIQQFYGPKLAIWQDLFMLYIGGNIGLSAMYYVQNDRSGWYLRPEIGLGLPRLHLKYGFGFRMAGDQVDGFQRHSLTLGYHISLMKRHD